MPRFMRRGREPVFTIQPIGGSMPKPLPVTKRVLRSEFVIGMADIASADQTDSTPGKMTDLLAYKVPRHTRITFRPDDKFIAVLKDTAAAALSDITPWELIATDPNGITSEILSNGINAAIKETQDRNKQKFLNVFRTIEDDFIVKLRVKTTTVTADASASTLALHCLREAETL